MLRSLLAAVVLLAALGAEARTVEGVELIDRRSARDGTELVLHGAGVRSKFFFDIYVGALYLPEAGQSADRILARDQAGRIEMHFLYDEVSRDKLAEAWRTGFRENNPAEVRDTIEPVVPRFIDLFPAATEGDVFAMEYVPGSGTRVSVNGEARGTVGDAVFFRALLAVFLGPEPPDGDLKRGMLDGD